MSLDRDKTPQRAAQGVSAASGLHSMVQSPASRKGPNQDSNKTRTPKTRILPKEPGDSLPSQGSECCTNEKKPDKMPKLIKMTNPKGLCLNEEVSICDFTGMQARRISRRCLGRWPAALCGIQGLKALERINRSSGVNPYSIYKQNPSPSQPPRLIHTSAVC